jgi:hypothetical protein
VTGRTETGDPRPSRAAIITQAATPRRIPAASHAALACLTLLAAILAGCAASAAPSVPATPPPTATPAPTATPLPGSPLPAGYRPEGDWAVTFALPGDFVKETWRIVLACPKGQCDAVVEIRDQKGKVRGRGEMTLQDGRYVLRSTATATISCSAGGTVVKGGATRRTETEVVLATYRLAGTAVDQHGIQGRRTVRIEPQAGSGCAASSLVYPASGELAAQ